MPSDLCTTCVVRHIRYNDIVIVNSVARHKICMKRKSYRIKAKVSRWQLCESEVMCIFVCNCVCVWVLANMSCIKMLLMLQTIICRIGCHTNATTLFQLTRFCDNSFPCVCVLQITDITFSRWKVQAHCHPTLHGNSMQQRYLTTK